MAYIKRAKHYSIVRGVTRGENGELVDAEDEAIYWANCEFGDDTIIDYPGSVNGNVVEDDIIAEEK